MRRPCLFLALALWACSSTPNSSDGPEPDEAGPDLSAMGTTGSGGQAGARSLASGGSSGSSGSFAHDASAGTGGSMAGGGAGGSKAARDAGNADGSIVLTGGAPGGPSSSRFTARPRGTVNGATHGYWEYFPPHYGNGALYPLIVFLHGSGERGSGSASDLQAILDYGIPRLLHIDSWPETRTFVVLSPQHTGDGCMTETDVATFLAFAMGYYDVDPQHVYVTGLSCGGIGTWDYIGAHLGEKVAAVVPISGDGRPAFQKAGCQLGRIPIWAFCGGADPIVPPAGSIETLASIQACTSPAPVDAKLTVYPGVGHDAWSQTYDLSSGNDIYAWMLSHQKP